MELYHHGVKGMKWGVRRKLKSASYTVKLNSMDSKRAKKYARYMKADAKAVKNPNEKKNKLKLEARRRDLSRIDSDIVKVIIKASSDGHEIYSADVTRNAELGKQMVTRYMTGIVGGLAINMYRDKTYYKGRYQVRGQYGDVVEQTPWRVKGTKYQVL